jgi:ATP-dependent protease ClpP protease subunit
MHTAWGFTVRGEGSSVLEIDIYDFVGGGFFFEGVTARSVRRILKESPNAKTIKLRINSEGGDVFEGFAIYNLLAEHPARVEADIDALAGSVASVIAMAADEIRIAANAWVMIHNPWGGAHGEPDDLRRWADVLDKMRGQAADIYAARTGMSRSDVLGLMDAETWMTAAEAKANGFVDKVTPVKKAQQNAAARAFASMRLDDYARVPDGVRELVMAARAQRKHDISPEPERPGSEIQEGDTMNKKVLAQALGITESAPDESYEAAAVAIARERDESRGALALAKAQLSKLEALTGKTGDEAVGVAYAWKQSHEELPAVSTELARLKEERLAVELDTAIATAKAESRHTPAREDKVRKLLADKDVSIVGATSMVAEWGVVKALAAAKDGAESAGNSTATTSQLKHAGKTFAEMSGKERAALKREDPAAYAAMRDAQPS